MLQFKQKIHGWIRDVGRERDAAMEAKSQKDQVYLEVCHERSQVDIQVCHHQAQGHQRVTKHQRRSSERFLVERQTAELKPRKFKVEEEYAKSRARVKVLEDLEGES